MSDVLEELRAFLAAQLPPVWVDAMATGDDAAIDEQREAMDRRAFVRLLGAAGWVAPHWPVEHGGRGLDAATGREALAELDRWRVPRVPRGSGLSLAAPTIIEWSDDGVKRRFLPNIVTGEERWCQLFSEPGAGSDLASLATSAVRDGDEWVINGQKVWTTLGHQSEFAMLLARTDNTVPKHNGITYFAMDMHAPGVEVRPLVQMTGEWEFNEVFLTDVRVPDAHRISPVGKGWSATTTTLTAERHTLSGASVKRRPSDEILGGMTFDQVLALARARGVTGDPLWRDRIVREHIRSRVLAMMSLRSRAGAASGRPPGPEGSVTKIAKAAANQSLQVLAMDILGAGGTAWLADDVATPEFVRQFLRTRANSIEGGTSEIQRNIVGERVLGLPREPDLYRGEPWNTIPR